MRRIAWGLLVLLAFAIPWEYSLDLGEPLGNIARVLGILLLLVAIPADLQACRVRAPGAMLWLVLALYLWFCCSYFWTIDPLATTEKMRGYFQEMMIVWLVWEFAESPEDLRSLLRAYVAGAGVLAVLTLANFGAGAAIGASQVRFFAEGQDPNDTARFLDLGFPFASLLVCCELRWRWRLIALGYLPLGLVAVVLTGSRGGLLAGLAALLGCGLLLMRHFGRRMVVGILAFPVVVAGLWVTIPRETIYRLATIPSQLQGGDLNQRWNIWHAGWSAFVRAPLVGTGAGSFVSASGLNSLDTAHNTALSIVVGGGLCALTLLVAVGALSIQSALTTHGPLKWALMTALTVWVVVSLVSTVEESRATWLLLGMVGAAGRVNQEMPRQCERCFPSAPGGTSKVLNPASAASLGG